jgi:hypothetical protein
MLNSNTLTFQRGGRNEWRVAGRYEGDDGSGASDLFELDISFPAILVDKRLPPVNFHV